ncbi:MAG: DoxX family protein [Burkholderiales bacterium]|nr:DoxX family protein [Burkholderiales bacterium]
MNALTSFGPLLGRILIALIFVASGFSKITGFEGTVGYIASKGLPFASLGAIAAIIVELGGGIMLIVGWGARYHADHRLESTLGGGRHVVLYRRCCLHFS